MCSSDLDAQNYDVVVMQVEGRDESDDGWVWLDNANRYYLTVGVRDESGDDKQSESWMEWEWAGPLTPPNAPSAAAARDG